MTENEKRADEIVGVCLNAVEYNCDYGPMKWAIARALDEAEERGRLTMARQYLNMNGKVPPEGHILDDKGVVRKVLRPHSGPPIYLTKDGAIVPTTETTVYSYERHAGWTFKDAKVIAMNFGTWFAARWDDCAPACWNRKAPDGWWDCYSTKEAAESARGGQ